jgi:hypothetical protein
MGYANPNVSHEWGLQYILHLTLKLLKNINVVMTLWCKFNCLLLKMSRFLVKDACDGNMESFVARDTTKRGEKNWNT